MDIEKKYNQVYQDMAEIVEKRNTNHLYTALGYTSNLDLLCDFQTEYLNQLLERYIPEHNLSEMKVRNPIRTIEDLLCTITYFCINGIGGEVNIEESALVERYFSCQYGMGGTAVQAALALSKIGCPSIVHLTDDSKEVCSLLKKSFVKIISKQGEIADPEAGAQNGEQEIHCIIQFQKGEYIHLRDQKVKIPCSNRLILTKVTVNQVVLFSDSYFRWIEQHASKVKSNVLSGFNTIVDAQILSDRLRYVKAHLKKYRENNPQGIVFFEDAHYHVESIKRICIENLYAWVDIVSLNEEELKYTLESMYGFAIDLDDIFSCVRGAKFLRKNFKVRQGVIVHTKDYSMYVGNVFHADIEKGMIYGNMMATAKAKNGNYGTMDQIKSVLKLEFSKKGIEHYQKIKDSELRDEVILVPTKYIENPRYTIGLGDSFVGGVQLCFL